MRWLIVLLITATLAGCASEDTRPTLSCPDGEQEIDGTCYAVSGDGSGGLLRGVVVDAAIVPMADIPIQVRAGSEEIATGVTDEEGLFAFAGLAAGSYEVVASKPGYEPTSMPATVDPDDLSPPILRMQLVAIPGYNPFSELITWNGYLQCNSNYVNACLIINYYPQALAGADPILDDTSIKVWWDEFVEKNENPAWVQAETHWEPSQLLGSSLNIRYEVGSPDDTFIPCVFGTLEGESPLVYAINASQTADAGLGMADPAPDDEGCDEEQAWGFAMEFFSGDALGVCQPTPVGCYPELGVTLGQDTETFITHFYGYTPPEGWTFSEQGSYAPPS